MWLDPERTSPYEFYQFWLNSEDRDVVNYLKFFTFESRAAIAELERIRALRDLFVDGLLRLERPGLVHVGQLDGLADQLAQERRARVADHIAELQHLRHQRLAA